MDDEERSNREKEHKLMEVSEAAMLELPFHNFHHVVGVIDTVNRFYEYSKERCPKISEEDRHILASAAALHDIIYIPGKNDNEEKSGKFAALYLPTLDYSHEEIESVRTLISMTRMSRQPSPYFLGELICDADLHHLGTEEFYLASEKLREETDLCKGIVFEDKEWLSFQLGFLETHNYHTDIAKIFFDKGKERNIRELEKHFTQRN